MTADRVYCHRCERVTEWQLARGGKFLRCAGCRDRFPCRNPNCGHLDCRDARESTAKLVSDHAS